ncbi:MAG: hypothetical protein BWY83_03169 [bacterium ADurb.Bin478]|nr:MAG: hypothetical protein BWY83_03169 [bacterium ADurb.Bin478]
MGMPLTVCAKGARKALNRVIVYRFRAWKRLITKSNGTIRGSWNGSMTWNRNASCSPASSRAMFFRRFWIIPMNMRRGIWTTITGTIRWRCFSRNPSRWSPPGRSAPFCGLCTRAKIRAFRRTSISTGICVASISAPRWIGMNGARSSKWAFPSHRPTPEPIMRFNSASWNGPSAQTHPGKRPSLRFRRNGGPMSPITNTVWRC